MKLSLVSLLFFALIFWATHAMAASPPPVGAVLTWHDDNFRSGWQQRETILTTATVGKLGIAHAVTLQDSVYAQPLVIPRLIYGHDVAYVVDESNNVYQIDANTGVIRTQVNLGRPVSRTAIGCSGGPRTGIDSTPVIDWITQTLLVITYVNLNAPPQPVSPAYFLHALDLFSLNDKVAPTEIAASHTLTNGVAVAFNPAYQRQRAALLFANGKVYAAFASQCDTFASVSRGWVLGWEWNGTTLAALPANQLDDRQPPPPYGFLDTVWMSSAGPASDEAGNLYFSTGNSNGDAAKTSSSSWTDNTPCSGTATGTVPTNVPCSNIQESVVKLNGDLTEITGLFSPNAHYGSFSPDTLYLDQHDEDLGSGGVMLAPQRGAAFLAAMAGKDGRLFLFDRSGAGLKFLQFRQGQQCWCAPSYFTGPDGVGRIVASQGKEIQTFTIPATSLSPEGTSVFQTGQDPGFFTTVSCNGVGAFGNCTNTPIIWAVSRPIAVVTPDVNLSAYSASAASGTYLRLLGPMKMGTWSNIGGNAPIVPTVSNGQVYVASDKLLTILKIGGTGALPLAAAGPLTTSAFMISGTLDAVNGSVLTVTDRKGKEKLIDASKAIAEGLVAPVWTLGEAYTAFGSSLTSSGVLHADAIYRAKCRQRDQGGGDVTRAQPACTGDQWPPDKDPGN